MTPKGSLATMYIKEPDQPRAEVTVAPEDRIAVALDHLFGTRGEQLEAACRAAIFSRQHQAKLWITHRRIAEAHRQFTPERAATLGRMYEIVTGDSEPWHIREATIQSDWASALGAALNRRLLASYSEPLYGEETIMRSGSSPDLRDQRAVSIDGFPDLPIVDPDAGNYVEMPKLNDREVAFSMATRGAVWTVSRKTVQNNDVDAVQRGIDSLARSARRTLAKTIWNLWVSNATYAADGTAWFTSGHGNLQTSAINEAEVIAAVLKLLNMTEAGNGERLGTRVRVGSLYLAVPNQLWDASYKLNQSPTSSLYHLFGVDNEFIIANPLLVDSNDWGIHRASSEVESIRCNFLQGREDPEVFIADTPNAHNMLVGDKIAWKIRHEYGAGVVETKGAVKAQV